MESWEGECDFAYLDETYQFNDTLDIDANVASKEIKRKFRFPSQDPSENVIVDDREDSKKVADILRIWSQVLTPDEAEIWSDIAERDVSKDISLRSGLRTPESIIDREIKMFKDISSKNKNSMSSLLQRLPETPCIETSPLSTQDSSLTTPLSFSSNKLPNLSHLNTDTVANFGSLEPDDNQSEGQSECRTSPFEQVNLQELSDDCEKQVQFLRQQNKHPQRLHLILKSNSKLLFKFMILLKSKHKLRKNMSSIFSKLMRGKFISLKLIKKTCGVLAKAQIVCKHWLLKPVEEIEANSLDPGLMIKAIIDEYPTSCVLDTGSTFTLIPYQVWKNLNINQSCLNSKVQFNINSASHKVKDAVLGQLNLRFKIHNVDGDSQIINQNCLVLRPTLDLQYVLLGNDFLSSNDVHIIYSQDKKTVLLNSKHVHLLVETGTTNFTNISALSVAAMSPTDSFMAPDGNGFDQHINMKSQYQNKEATDRDEERKQLQEFFSLDPNTDMVQINAFMQSCKEAKYSYHNQTISANSVHQENLDDVVASDFEKRSIIPEEGVSRPSPEISHLSKNLQGRIKDIVNRHEGLFSKNKHHLGRFTGFKAVAQMDVNSKINCRQPPRNRVLPPSCKADLLKYKKSGLFEHSTGGSDDYCANLTLVLRNQVREQRSNTKADKNLHKNTKKEPQPPSKVETQPLPDGDLAKPEKSLYRMTIDFRSINLITLNEKTSQLPSIQAIENNFHNAIVSTIDLSNCYPSIEIEENSRNFFNFYVENEVWQHRRLAQGWSASLAIAQRAVLWTFRDQALLDFMASRNLTAEQFPFKAY